MDNFNNINKNVLERIFIKVITSDENIIEYMYNEVIKLTKDVNNIEEINENIDIVINRLIRIRKERDRIIWNTL